MQVPVDPSATDSLVEDGKDSSLASVDVNDKDKKKEERPNSTGSRISLCSTKTSASARGKLVEDYRALIMKHDSLEKVIVLLSSSLMFCNV